MDKQKQPQTKNTEKKQAGTNRVIRVEKVKNEKAVKARKIAFKTTAIFLASFLAFCLTMAAVAIVPQFRKKGTRYESIKDFNNGSVHMIAHRGLSGMALENTVKAFELAGENDYYGIEADVHVTKDNKFIIIHDDDLKRIADKDIVVEESTFAQLRALKFKDVYGDGEEATYQLPSLYEYLEVCQKYNKRAILELKNEMTENNAKSVARAVSGYGWFKNTTFISFSQNNLLSIKKAYPSAELQYLVQYASSSDIDFMIENEINGSFSWVSITPARVRKLHKAGLKVGCWTVDGRLMAWWMKTCGVDYITSNILV